LHKTKVVKLEKGIMQLFSGP